MVKRSPDLGHNSQGSRFESVANVRIKAFLHKVAEMMEERGSLTRRFRQLCDQASAISLKPKILKKVVRFRKMDVEQRRQEQELLNLYKAADGME